MKTTGQAILITGGTSGIGLAFAKHFLQLGNKVIICARRNERLHELGTKHPGLITRACNVVDATQREDLANWIKREHPETNILINNAGIQLATNLIQPVNIDRIHAELETNVVAPVHLTSLLASHLTSKPEAAVINIGSGLAFVPLAFMPIYCASKAALHSITLSLRHQLKDTSVKVFEIAPPSVDTELGHDMRSDKTQSHGGMPVQEFLAEAMQALENDELEYAVGMAKNMRANREDAFATMNDR